MYNFAMKEITSIHKDHRKRVREKFNRVGFEGFADHEILELLLFYSIPYKDTNPIAHNLISHFGSIEDVFAASKEELETVKGVSENTATLIKLIPALSTKLTQQLAKKCAHISGWADAIRYCSFLFGAETKEKVYVICLDNKNDVRATKLISTGNSTAAIVDTKELAKFILQRNYSNIIIAHNHPIGSSNPSNEDIVFTKQIISTLAPLDIKVIDHVIISPTEATSMAHDGIIKQISEYIPATKSLHKVSDKMLKSIDYYN